VRQHPGAPGLLGRFGNDLRHLLGKIALAGGASFLHGQPRRASQLEFGFEGRSGSLAMKRLAKEAMVVTSSAGSMGFAK